jgi:hypothetical protein
MNATVSAAKSMPLLSEDRMKKHRRKVKSRGFITPGFIMHRLKEIFSVVEKFSYPGIKFPSGNFIPGRISTGRERYPPLVEAGISFALLYFTFMLLF